MAAFDMRQCLVVFAGACVSVSMRIEFVWRIRGYVHKQWTHVQLVISFATFPVIDRTAGLVGSSSKSCMNWRVGWVGSRLSWVGSGNFDPRATLCECFSLRFEDFNSLRAEAASYL